MNTEMNTEMNTLLETIKSDYMFAKGTTEVQIKMTKEFNEGLCFKVGKKYIKVMSAWSVWGFIVNVDNDAKFKKGDILMAAGRAAPARNFPRGNIIDGGYKVQWTGPQ
jgi:hypothetical protein